MIIHDIVAFVMLNASESSFIPSNKEIIRFAQNRACELAVGNDKIF
jgi:hypothetical protein